MTDSNPSSEPDRQPLILVVDDEPSVRAMVLAAIRVRGPRYRITEAARAEEAVDAARQDPPDLVLLDVALPDHDGFWVCRELKSGPSTAHIPVIMLTAMGLPSDRDRAVAAGADGYIVKPFSPRALLLELERRLA
jgi:two-component system phosphate regulon response regulator PhoB